MIERITGALIMMLFAVLMVAALVYGLGWLIDTLGEAGTFAVLMLVAAFFWFYGALDG